MLHMRTESTAVLDCHFAQRPVESCVCFVHAAPELLHIVIEAGHTDGHPPWLWVGACSSRPVGRMGVVPGSSCVWPC